MEVDRKEISVPIGILNEVLGYLSKQPFFEVAPLITKLDTIARAQLRPVPPVQAIKKP
jgi:hypothetical protein